MIIELIQNGNHKNSTNIFVIAIKLIIKNHNMKNIDNAETEYEDIFQY